MFFSGGISGCEISKIGKAELMMINVTQFYSENMFVFLKNNANNLLELAFGNNWHNNLQDYESDEEPNYLNQIGSQKHYFQTFQEFRQHLML